MSSHVQILPFADFIRKIFPQSSLISSGSKEWGRVYDFAGIPNISSHQLPELEKQFRNFLQEQKNFDSDLAPVFRFHSISGAYQDGDERKAMLQRFSLWIFPDKESLAAYALQRQSAEIRDHRSIGRELEIFHLDDQVGRGLPLWLPNGCAIRDELERLMKELEFKAGYSPVSSPHIARIDLYRQSGHLPYYEDSMYPAMKLADGESYCLRPMNCPHHHLIYGQRPRSYRELPLRLSEYGQVYRYEDSGALLGLMRVRSLCINDGHIYCARDQLKDELRRVLELHLEAYRLLALSNFSFRLSCWDPHDSKKSGKFVDQAANWDWSEHILRELLLESKLPFQEAPGEAAFYGPKIDIQMKAASGREESISSIQVDFSSPARFGMKYLGADNFEHEPVVIHRAPLGSHERFVGFLLEHFEGRFPLWLAPIQVLVLAVDAKSEAGAIELAERLRSLMVRAEVKDASASLGRRIQSGIKRKIPIQLILGQAELRESVVSLRLGGKVHPERISVEHFIKKLLQALESRAINLDRST